MNCKPGDMAIVMGTQGIPMQTPGVIGRVVEVLRAHSLGSTYRSVNGKTMHTTNIGANSHWVVRSSTPLPWLVLNGPNAGEVWLFEERCIMDSSLRPISGVPVDDEVTEDLKEPA